MAGSLLGAMPTVLVFVLFNQYFLRGLQLHGGMK
jgi:ABC-type glycerol-3-phosphate transport system permease component